MDLITAIKPLYALSGFVVGALVGMTGVGGGSLMTPLLILLFGIHASTAVGTDLLYACATKTGQYLGIAMLATSLCNINRIAYLVLDRIRKSLQILSARPHPDHWLERRRFGYLA